MLQLFNGGVGGLRSWCTSTYRWNRGFLNDLRDPLARVSDDLLTAPYSGGATGAGLGIAQLTATCTPRTPMPSLLSLAKNWGDRRLLIIAVWLSGRGLRVAQLP